MAQATRVLTAAVNGTIYTTTANGALEAVDTCHSGATAPTDELVVGKLWFDTSSTPGILKIYNNSVWETIVSTVGDITDVLGDTPELTITSNNPISTASGTEDISSLGFRGQKNDLYRVTAKIQATQQGTWSTVTAANSPSALEFYTQSGGSPDAMAAPRMLIDNDGNVAIATTAATEKLEVGGNIILDAANAHINIKPGVSGTSGAVNWTFNTDDTAYASMSLAYNTRASLGLVADTGYPISLQSNGSSGFIRFQTHTAERMRLTNTGLGIGTTAPGAPLHVEHATDNIAIRIRDTGAAAGKYWNVGSDGSSSFVVSNQAGNGVYVADGGTNWTGFSDERLKTNIKALGVTSGLDAITKLKAVTFDWKDAGLTKIDNMGLIAQNVRDVFPGLVNTTPKKTIQLDDGTEEIITEAMGVEYTGLIAPLIKATQELKAIVDAQATLIASLETRITTLGGK